MSVDIARSLAETEFASGLKLIRAWGIVHDFPRHVHQSLLLLLITRGERIIDARQESFRLVAGQGVCLPPDYPHACRAFAPHDYQAVSIPVTLWRALLDEDVALPEFAVIDGAGTGLTELLELIATLRFDADPMAVETTLLAVQAVLQPGVSHQYPPGQQAMVQQVRDWLLAHYTEPVRLADLAALTGWRTGMVNRIFREHIGVPPYEFLLHQRLREVARLLRSGSRTLVDIAIDMGFADQSHMQRLFRRAFGVTPKAYREGAALLNRLKPVAD